MALRLRRGTDAERLLVTPLQGELVYATDTKKLYVGDGATVGGVLVGPADADQFTELVADTSPQLGGDLDLNGNNITGNGNIDINGTITATGNIGLGDDTADIINVGGVINSPLRPAIDGNYDLGSTIRRWNRLYAEGAVLSGQLDAEAVATGRILSNSSTVVYDEITDTLAAANINGTTVDATTVNATTINAGEVVANFRGSIFSDDSTPVFDGINKTINVKGGTLDGVTIGGDGITPTRNITGREVTATNGFIGNLTGDSIGIHKGNVTGNDDTVLIDAEDKIITNGAVSLTGSVISGSTTGTAYGGADFPSADLLVAIGDRTTPHVAFIEGSDVPLVIRGESSGSSATTLVVQGSRFSGETLTTVQEDDFVGQVAFDGFNGSEMKRAALLTSEVKSALNAGNFDTDVTLSVLKNTGLYSQYVFKASGLLQTAGLNLFSASEAELTGIASIAQKGSIGFGDERDSMVIYDGSDFQTVTTTVDVPSGPTATGKEGQVAGDANYMYFCYSDDNWIRVAKDGTWT